MQSPLESRSSTAVPGGSPPSDSRMAAVVGCCGSSSVPSGATRCRSRSALESQVREITTSPVGTGERNLSVSVWFCPGAGPALPAASIALNTSGCEPGGMSSEKLHSAVQVSSPLVTVMSGIPTGTDQ